MRKAFTLIEVNLAMLIMAGGVLSIAGLYSFGFRENRQSREDVAGAALADAILSPLVMAASDTNVTWSSFSGDFCYPSQGWRAYLDSDYQTTQDPTPTAKSAFSSFMSKMSGAKVDTSFPDAALTASKLKCAVVIKHERDSGVVSIAFRATDKINVLMSQPLYYVEARFQGVQE